ncbi:MAG: oxygen-independent coproporphyrinogen III oxidase [Acidobacteria bacterium]|jgi:oxygen-independent coproporphyrinogen-3 oxidase|nr:oxygen-independent coproporphyrinogen III oxidase [Acidobacteriota bacterium]
MNKEVGKINVEVLKKFNQPGPRYTSYPTAPLFSNEFSAEDFTREIAATNSAENTSDISLYLHFPFCEQLCYFCGCNMMVSHDRALIREYNEYLKREIAQTLPIISRKRKLAQMHWGGGTPSYLTPGEITDIGTFIKQNFQFAKDAEASVEIDPRGLTAEHMAAFRGCGFNRISMGVQDFYLPVQQAINRVQSEEITRQAVVWARQLGFQSVNLDLIYGLPHQILESFAVTVDKIIDISPDRLAVFNYAHVPWLKKHQNLIKAKDLPSADERLQILQMTIEKLTGAGYEYIGMDHFAKKTDELATAQRNNTLYRNFQGYSTKAGCDVYAFGMSAISQFQNIYAQNVKNLKDYYARINAGCGATSVGYRMTFDDHIRKETIMQLMCHLEIDKRNIEKRFGINFENYFADDVKKLDVFIEGNLLENNAEKIKIVGAGKMIIRNIAMCFDAYLTRMIKEKPVFSKTV